MEEWREIPGYPDYRVSNYGRICSYYTGRQKILKPIMEKYNGYYCVSLFDIHRKMKKIKVHRLVAEAFIPNPQGYSCINHKDEVKTNNNADNLEWCTRAYNTTYGTAPQRRRESYLKYLAAKRAGQGVL